jgi:hypothetical protein
MNCKEQDKALTTRDFKPLMQNVAEGWSTRNSALALQSFDPDAIYMEPPNIQYYRGHAELKPYFDALGENHRMTFHALWFDEKTQTGAGEYTFSYGKDTSNVGIAVVELKNGKIAFWREYQQKGPTNFPDFIAVKDKKWLWHIGNYPKPKEVLKTE